MSTNLIYPKPKISDPVLIKEISLEKVRVLLKDYTITLPHVHKIITIPEGFVTDGHTYCIFDILLESFYGSRISDEYILSSLVHDYLYVDEAHHYVDNVGVSRHDADIIYHELRQYERNRPILHGICYLGLRYFGWIYYKVISLGDIVTDENTGLRYISYNYLGYKMFEFQDFLLFLIFFLAIFFLVCTVYIKRIMSV